MLIDWFTVVAQAVNFLVLVFLLKHFLYGRIVRAMKEREAKIASQLKEAEDKRKEADREAESFRKKNEELEKERDAMLAEAKQAAEAKRKELMKRAREEVDEVESAWREALAQQKASFIEDLRQRVVNQVSSIARNALKDLADEELNDRVVGIFLQRISKLDDKRRRALLKSIEKSDNRVVVRSAFELDKQQRQSTAKAIGTHIQEGLDVQYETSPDVIAGIELRTHGHKLAWSLDSYLESLETHLTEAFDAQSRAEVPGEDHEEVSGGQKQ